MEGISKKKEKRKIKKINNNISNPLWVKIALTEIAQLVCIHFMTFH